MTKAITKAMFFPSFANIITPDAKDMIKMSIISVVSRTFLLVLVLSLTFLINFRYLKEPFLRIFFAKK